MNDAVRPQAHAFHPGEWIRCPDCGHWQEIDYEQYTRDILETTEQCEWCSTLIPVKNPLHDLNPNRTPRRAA